MDQLVDITLKSGLIPQVVMEFPGITVGGGFSGTSGESSSYKYGFFENTVSWIEIVLANGEVTTASATINSDLFEGAAGSFGTLGVTTLLEVKLIDAKSFVELTYLPVQSASEAVKQIEHATEDPTHHDYVDGMLFSQDQGVVMTGILTDTVKDGVKIERFSRPSDQWFYRYAQKRLAADPTGQFSIAIPIVDYLFRYDRGAFWGGMWAFKYFLTPFNRITRYVLDPFMHARVMFHALHASGFAKQYIVQDIGFPSSTVTDFIDYLDENFAFYPLWLCPLRKGHKIPLHPRAVSGSSDSPLSKEMVLNVGIWGPGPKNHADFITVNRDVERKTRELSGLKCLYARAYYTEDEFWEVYDRQWYEAVRTKYDANSLPNVYDKIKVDLSTVPTAATGIWSHWPLAQVPGFWDIWPTAGIYGVLKAFIGLYSPFGKDYILAKG